jgi:hypothetical protein
MSQMNPVHNFPFCFSTTHSNIFPSTLRSSERFPPFRFFDQNFVRRSYPCRACYMSNLNLIGTVRRNLCNEASRGLCGSESYNSHSKTSSPGHGGVHGGNRLNPLVFLPWSKFSRGVWAAPGSVLVLPYYWSPAGQWVTPAKTFYRSNDGSDATQSVLKCPNGFRS